jgi:hypothetical protein
MSPTLHRKKWAKTEKSGVGAVSVVAFTYEIYTIPSQNNGVLRATLTMQMSAASFQSAQFSVAPARGSDHGLPGLAVKKAKLKQVRLRKFSFLRATFVQRMRPHAAC